MIINEWPEDTSEVPKHLRKYFTHASNLAVEDGLILKGEALFVTMAHMNLSETNSFTNSMMDTKELPRPNFEQRT